MDFFSIIRKKIEQIHSLYLITFLFVLGFIAYGNALGNGLFFDDQDFIYDNVYVQQFAVDKFFTENAIAGVGKTSNYYRPLQQLSYSVEYQLFGSTPFIYHLDNILLHITATILLFLLLRKLFKNTTVALLTSILFLIHPVQTEAVAYASGRNDPLAAIFIFATLLSFLKNTNKSYILSLFFFILALLSRESALVTPALLKITSDGGPKGLLRGENLKRLLPYIGIAGFYFLLRLTTLNFENTLNFYNDTSLYATNLFVRLLTFLSTLPTYIGLLFYPRVLYIDRTADVITSISNTNVIVSIVAIVLLFLFCIKIRVKHPALPAGRQVFLFCLLWFFITITPTSGIIPINGIIYEHFLYLPSVGIFLAFSYLFYVLASKIKITLVSLGMLGIFGIAIALLTIRTIIRNNDWKNPITFYTQTIKYNPVSPRLHNNLAMALADEGKNTEAVKEYKAAIQLADIYPQTHYNLGNSYLAINNLDEAEKEYLKSLQIDPAFVRSYVALAKIYKAKEDKEKLKQLMKEIELLSQKNPQFIPLLETIKSL